MGRYNQFLAVGNGRLLKTERKSQYQFLSVPMSVLGTVCFHCSSIKNSYVIIKLSFRHYVDNLS